MTHTAAKHPPPSVAAATLGAACTVCCKEACPHLLPKRLRALILMLLTVRTGDTLRVWGWRAEALRTCCRVNIVSGRGGWQR